MGRLVAWSVSTGLVLSASAAGAHAGSATLHGLFAGMAHPLLGLDHVLAMVAIGLWASQLGRLASWLVPAGFILVASGGGALAFVGAPLPLANWAVLGSVIILGLLLATSVRISTIAVTGVVATFALFHGHAHGTELVLTAASFGYGAGLALSTVLLHILGIVTGRAMRQLGGDAAPRYAGGVVAAALGVVVVLGI